jgi:hypothetical protein
MNKKGIISASILFVFLCISLNSCSKKEIPVLTTSEVTDITIYTATCGGTILDEGSSPVISLGVCWNTEAEPTISDFKTSEMAGVSEFSSSLRGLLRGTKYYVRAYGVNDDGIGYGNEVTFTTLP